MKMSKEWKIVFRTTFFAIGLTSVIMSLVLNFWIRYPHFLQYIDGARDWTVFGINDIWFNQALSWISTISYLSNLLITIWFGFAWVAINFNLENLENFISKYWIKTSLVVFVVAAGILFTLGNGYFKCIHDYGWAFGTDDVKANWGSDNIPNLGDEDTFGQYYNVSESSFRFRTIFGTTLMHIVLPICALFELFLIKRSNEIKNRNLIVASIIATWPFLIYFFMTITFVAVGVDTPYSRMDIFNPDNSTIFFGREIVGLWANILYFIGNFFSWILMIFIVWLILLLDKLFYKRKHKREKNNENKIDHYLIKLENFDDWFKKQ